MKYTFITDLHIGANNQILFEEAILKNTYSNLFLLGDIFDLANCKKSWVEHYNHRFNFFKNILRARYITGNHELQKDQDNLIKITNKVGAMHGDLIFWGKEKSEKYRHKEPGAGFFKRNLWVNALEAIEHGYDRKVSTEDLERFYSIAIENNLDRIIVGHMHPSKQLDIEYKGKILTVLKRGVTEIELE